jgi:hypothetical protein
MLPRPLIAALILSGCATTGGPIAPSEPAITSAYTPGAPLPGAAHALFSIPRSDGPLGFFDAPWPSEIRRDSRNRPDLRAFPGRDAVLFDGYVEAAERDVDGFGLTTAIYVRLEGQAGSLRLPRDPRETTSARSTIFLVDVDPKSPDRGSFLPIDHRYYDQDLRYVPARTLAMKPALGVVLRPSTLYAAVVRRDLIAGDLGTTMDLEAIKWTRPRSDPREERARAMHAAALDLIAERGCPRDRVAAIALFRTHAPHAITTRLVDAIEHLPADRRPRVIDARWVSGRGGHGGRRSYRVIEGTYCTPNFQSHIERAPFVRAPGGRLALDDQGAPRVVDVPKESAYFDEACHGMIRARFVMTVPHRRAPKAGYPLLVSAHGTGGSAKSFLGRNDFAGWGAAEGYAVVSTDQPLHGGRGSAPRPGSREPIEIAIAGIPIPMSTDTSGAEVAFYNPIFPFAARDNLRQAAADAMVLTRLVLSADLGALLGPSDRAAPRFDRSHVVVAGHSQGSQSMAAVGAVDPLVKGVILSGSGGDARLGVLRRDDIPIVDAFAAVTGMARGELDETHPFMTVVAMLTDPIDPATYARFYTQPLPGRRAQNVLHFEGIGDGYTPNETAQALAIALRMTPVAPLDRPSPWLGPAASLDDVLRQRAPRPFVVLTPTRGEDGHFVIFREPRGGEIVMRFLREIAARP